MIRWWPPVAVSAMVLLGLAVGTRSTPVDDWFLRFSASPTRHLLFFSQPALIAVVMMGAAAVAFDRRRERLAWLVVLAPIAAWALVQLLKRVFDRRKDGVYAYPSGHITLTVVVVGMAVLVAGAAAWSVYTATVVVVLACLGQGTVHHYFTDTIGGVLLGTAIVAVAALLTPRKLTRVNPMRSTSHQVVNMRA
jgi:membrane-associated phospholipid phosphatase